MGRTAYDSISVQRTNDPTPMVTLAFAASIGLHVGLICLLASADPPAVKVRRTAHTRLFIPPDPLLPPTLPPEKTVEPPPPEPPKPEPPPPEPPPPEVPEVTAGIDDGVADTPAWLGFREATPHAAPLSTVEQSALSPAPGERAPIGAPPSPASSPSPDRPLSSNEQQHTPIEFAPNAKTQVPAPDARPQPATTDPSSARPDEALPPPDAAPPTHEKTGIVDPPAESNADHPPKPEARSSTEPPVPDAPVMKSPPSPKQDAAPGPQQPGSRDSKDGHEGEKPVINAPGSTRDARETETPGESAASESIGPSVEDGIIPRAVPPPAAAAETAPAAASPPPPSSAPSPVPIALPTPSLTPMLPASGRESEPTLDLSPALISPGAAPSPMRPPMPPGTPATGQGVGEKSDAQSDASAIAEALTIAPGRVAAHKGLRITTVRPQWSITTQRTVSPRNPVVRITFGRNGRVLKAEFIKGQSTGYDEVDSPLLDALYRWTATGEALRRIPPHDPLAGVSMTFRVLLQPEDPLSRR